MSERGPGTGHGERVAPLEAPTIELKEIAKSEAKLDKGKIKTTLPWKDSTMVIYKGNDSDAEIFGHSLKRERSNIGKTTLVKEIDNKSLLDGNGKYGAKFLITSPSKSDGYLCINDAPAQTKKFLTKYWQINGRSGTIDVTYYNRQQVDVDYGPEEIKVVDGGKYIVFIDQKSGCFMAFETMNEQGIFQSPENWKKYEWNHKLPEDLQKYVVDSLEVFTAGVTDLKNEKYAASVSNVSVNIIDFKNPKEKPLFSDIMPEVGNNVISDPNDRDLIYYCSASSPKGIVRLDLTQGPQAAKKEIAKFPKPYKEVKNLQLDPTGSYFLFYSEDKLVMVSKETLEELTVKEGLVGVNFDEQGNITAVDNEGYLVKYSVDVGNLQETLAKQRANKLAAGVDIEGIFGKGEESQMYDEKIFEQFNALKDKWTAQLRPLLDKVTSGAEALQFRKSLDKLRTELRTQRLTEDQIMFVLSDIEQEFLEKEKSFAKTEVETVATRIKADLDKQLTVNALSEMREDLRKLQSLENVMDEETRKLYGDVLREVNTKANELFQKEGVVVIEEVNNLLKGIEAELEKKDSKRDFDAWYEFQLPKYKGRLQALLRDVPLEASEAYAKINDARNRLDDIAARYNEKFKVQYAQVREKASERTDLLADNLGEDIKDIKERLRQRGFKTREEAEQYLATSEAKKLLEDEIIKLRSDNPDKARELSRTLKVELANSLSDIERGGGDLVAESGQQLILFGKTAFPRFEAKVKEKGERKVDLTFAINEKQGPQASAKDTYGDLMATVTKSTGEKEKVRLFSDAENEDEWRLGLLAWRGSDIPPTYLSATEFKKVKQDYAEWERGALKAQYEKHRQTLKDLYAEREKVNKDKGQRSAGRSSEDATWREKYKAAFEEYKKFITAHNIPFFRQIDRIKNAEEADENGKGYVPKWKSNWVVDPETAKNLESMAGLFKMQLDLGEGTLNLNGHTGTGKDVLLKMFCNRVNRPYFSTDCTKWTTEFELSEDVMLESVNGATQTIKVPSAVLNGIRTPGAVVYFNEINAMPEQSQIFLHALFDEKRALTLKTSSGKVIEADPSILLASSMNPNYPGTFDPQFATKSRMVSLEIGYPPLETPPKPGDTNTKNMFNSSEAMRIARGVESLEDLTIDPNLDRNDFIKVWDNHVNGLKNEGVEKLTPVQKFDLDVIKALVQFGNQLRAEFIKNFEKTRDRNVLPVTQPITAREFQRCAYGLNSMPGDEKMKADPDAVARTLLDEFFLSHIYSSEDKKKIRQVMQTWSSTNRIN